MKVNGKQQDFALIRTEGTQIVISYGLQQVEGNLYEWHEVSLPKKQNAQLNFQMVKDAIIADINERITAQIIGGMTFEEKPVWLSIENQINFSQAAAPCRLKIGEEEDSTPVYHFFDTKASLKAFNDACLTWKNECLESGRAEKEGIDWAPYETLLPQTKQSE